MAWTGRKYSKGQIDRAGEALTALGKEDPAREEVIAVVDNWRACYAYPLQVIKMTLLNRAKKINPRALNAHALDVCVVRITTSEHRKFLRLRVQLRAGEGGLARESWAKCDQVTTIPKARLQYPPLGRISPPLLHAIEQRVRLALGLI